MKVTLKEITKENFKEIVRLKVREDQNHVASNVYSIAQSKYDQEEIPMAIYKDDTPVGFLMFAYEYEESCLWISRFMIDQKFQGQGIGTAALNLIKQIAIENKRINKIGLSTHLSNIEGIKFYEKFGFVDTKRDNNNPDSLEEIFEYYL